MTDYVYLSGPILGLTYDEARYGWRSEFADKLQDIGSAAVVLSPMRHEGYLAELRQEKIELGSLPENMFSRPKMIAAKDFLDIDKSSIVVANFLGAQRISQGTLIELGYAMARGKTVIVIQRPDDKVHTSPFIGVIADSVVSTLDEAVAIVASLTSEGI